MLTIKTQISCTFLNKILFWNCMMYLKITSMLITHSEEITDRLYNTILLYIISYENVENKQRIHKSIQK